MNFWRAIKRFLRRPAVILGEIAAIAVAGALGASLPELHVFQSVWFAAVTLLAAASLAVVVNEQFRRVFSQWRQPPVLAQFQSAPFKIEFERLATMGQASRLSSSDSGERVQIWSERRLGLAGSLVFHTGLLLLIVAGAWRALFATEAMADLIEGETLAPNAKWTAQWPGALAKPLRLEQSVKLESVNGRRYADGNLRELRATFSAGEIAVNHQLQFGGSRLYLAQEFGPVALLEWNSSQRVATLMTGNGRGNYSGESAGPDGLKIFLHSNSERPANLEIRVMRGEGLLAASTLGVGESIALPDGVNLALRGTPMWARLHASHDSALWLAYFGMILTMLGATMIFTLIKLDGCLVITPLGERERVFIALKPQRFAPLFQERFEALVLGQRESSKSGSSRGNEALIKNADDGKMSEPPHVGCHPKSALACTAGLLFLGSCLAFTSGCDRVTPTQAKQLVERYNQVVSEAYRRGDVRLIDPVVGPNEGKKLTGLIGVRLDLGLTLDAQLQSLEVTGFAQVKDALQVHTKERWSYRDLKIGTGAQVGEASQDAYAMTYYFTNSNKAWLVDEIKFAAPPQVGRTNGPWVADRATMHGATTSEARP